jgi:hypothetical protein
MKAFFALLVQCFANLLSCLRPIDLRDSYGAAPRMLGASTPYKARYLRETALALALSACGAVGHFEVGKTSYGGAVSAEARPSDTFEGVAVHVSSDPVRDAVDDEVQATVVLLWARDTPPTLNKDLFVSDNVFVPLIRISCFCGGREVAYTEPVPSGRVRFSKLEGTGSALKVEGELELTFKGQIALTSGGVLYDDETVKVSAFGFKLNR